MVVAVVMHRVRCDKVGVEAAGVRARIKSLTRLIWARLRPLRSGLEARLGLAVRVRTGRLAAWAGILRLAHGSLAMVAGEGH